MPTIWGFHHIENKHSLYRRKDCMRNYFLREQAKSTTDFEKKKMLPLRKEELKSYQDAIVCYICGKRFLKKFDNDKNYRKARDYCHITSKYRDAVHTIYNLRFIDPNEIPLAFHNHSNYDYYFIIEKLAKEFEGKFECPRENTGKY